MADDKILLTQDGLDDLKAELEERITVTRKKIADEIDAARQQGDLSENAAYKSAMESKEFNENRIAKLEDMIKNAEVTKKSSKGAGVAVGTTVILETDSGSKQEFQIVGQSEADPAERKISLDSPIGAALKAKKEGDTVTVDLPAGEVEFKIVTIK